MESYYNSSKKFQHFEENVGVGTLPKGEKHDFEESRDDIIRPSGDDDH